MKLLSTVVVLILCCCLPSLGEEGRPARLLVSKNILNRYLVEGKDLSVEYKIYNVGDSAAYKVSLVEVDFPVATFQTVSGSLYASWDRISPRTNITHAVIVRPLQSGYFNFTSARVTFQTLEEGGDRVLGFSSFPGELGIAQLKEYERRFSPRVLDWLVFAFMTLPSLGFPFLLWYKSHSRYTESNQKSS